MTLERIKKPQQESSSVEAFELMADRIGLFTPFHPTLSDLPEHRDGQARRRGTV
jgi:hypothetical protein